MAQLPNTPTGIYAQKNASVIQQRLKLFLGATAFAAFGTATLTREAKGKYYWSLPASGTVELVADLGAALRNFTNPVINYNQTTVNTPNAPLSLVSATASYLISTANLTSATVSISETLMPADNTATTPTVTDLLAPTTLALAFRADIYQTVLTPANPAILALSNSLLTAELVVVNPASAVAHFYGLLVELNYNV